MIKPFFLLSAMFVLTCISISATQPDTLKILRVSKAPVFDGKAEDAIWDSASWIDLDQVWIPWQMKIEPADFSGRYKVLWSEKDNLLYFVAEITDDIFRDGYVYDISKGDYANYDLFELFVDPNRSGGLHIFDGSCDDPKNDTCSGSNAENAFSYHINVNAPADGGITHEKIVEDIAGTDWDHVQIRNYADHLPDFTFRKNGNTYTYEFSLKIYKDTFDPQNPSEKDRDILKPGKIMGLTTAYCDDDHATGTPMRDHFIGSSKGDTKVLDADGNFNQMWKDCSYYGIAQLVVVKK